MQSCVCFDASAAVLRPPLSCSVLRFSSCGRRARSILRCSTPTQVYPPTHVHDYARKIDQARTGNVWMPNTGPEWGKNFKSEVNSIDN